MVDGYEHLIETLTLPDPDDRHVLAAAIHGGASTIVTSNLGDFPVTALAPHDISAVRPDDFLCELLTSDPETVIAALHADRTSLRNPPITRVDYLAALERVGLLETVAILKAIGDDS